MKLSNYRETFKDPRIISVWGFGTIDVTTGFFWWKKTVQRPVVKNQWGWFFADDGSDISALKMHRLMQVFEAQQKIAAIK